MTVLTALDIARVARAAGFTGATLVDAVSVALAESGGDPTARCHNTDKHHSTDRGLWQINDHWHPEWTTAQCDDPATCARAAWAISSHGTDWTPWSTWNNSAATAHRAAAERAVAELEAPTRAPATTPKETATVPHLSTWKGVRDDARTCAMLAEVDRLTPHIPFRPAQGGYNPGGVGASAGTHDRAAIDIRVAGLSGAQQDEVVRLMRMVGFAAWRRYHPPFSGPHIHAVPVGGDLAPAARAQVQAYFNGRNGLASHGRDEGPRQYVGTTWEKYQASRGKHATPTAAPAHAARQWFGPRPRPLLAVDGLAGPHTLKAFQEYLSSYIPDDGKWGPTSTRKAQQWLGVHVDGVFGTGTLNAFCRRLGMPAPYPRGWYQDRKGDPVTVALQKYLNTRR